jgi:hypothetical protein
MLAGGGDDADQSAHGGAGEGDDEVTVEAADDPESGDRERNGDPDEKSDPQIAV